MIKKIVLLFIFMSVWWGSRGWINTKKIECYTQFGLCSEEITNKLSWLKRTPLLFPLPQKKVADQLLTYPNIKSMRLYRRLPFTLVVSVNLRKPLGVITDQVLGLKIVVDQDGVVIDRLEKSQLPQLLVDYDPNKYKSGDQLTPPENKALQILAVISSLSGKQALGQLHGTILEAVLSDTTRILLDLKYLDPKWDSTLHLILSRSKIQAKVPKTIDLRFSSPIIGF